jgi:hypothetical protein
MVAVTVNTPRSKKTSRMAGTVVVLCGICKQRGSTNKALGYRNGEKIEACRACQKSSS